MTVRDCMKEIEWIDVSLGALIRLEDGRIANLSTEEVVMIRQLLQHYAENIKQKKIEA